MPSKKSSSTKKPAKPLAKKTPRRRGRPATHENGVLDSRLIISCAFELAKTLPLQELSMVRVARELGVTPALIHYYLDGRDALTSGVMNSFYREMLADWPVASGRWREDIQAVADHVYAIYVAYAGVAAYVISHTRFRMAQRVAPGETDYGLLLFERIVGVVREAGFDAARTGMYANLLMEFIISGAYATVRHRWPGEHGDFLDRVFAKLDRKQYPHTQFVRSTLISLDGSAAFREGMHLVLNGIDQERSKLSRGSATRARR